MEGTDRKENEIFVRNLAYSVKSEDLISLFEECGPVKRASIAQEGDVSKGFGFVKFAFPQDAIAAVEKFQGKELAGRRLILEIAVFSGKTTKVDKETATTPFQSSSTSSSSTKPSKSKPSPSTTGAETSTTPTISTTTPPAQASAQAPTPPVPGSSLQVIVSGVPSHVNKKMFKDIVQKVHHCKKLVVELIKEDHPLHSLVKDILSPSGRNMLLITHSRQDANTLITKLDNATPRSLGITVPNPSPETPVSQDSHQKLPNLAARLVKDITNEITRKQKCRLIIRNLSFQAIEENIVQKFRKFGPITEVNIPRVAVTFKPNKQQPRGKKAVTESIEKLKPRGFGFVTLLCEADAQKAVNGGCDGMKICNREFAVDFCLNRHAHEWELKRSEDEKEVEGGESAQGEDSSSKIKEDNNHEKDEKDDNDDMEESENDDNEEDEEEEEEENDENDEDLDNEDQEDEDNEDDDQDDDDQDNDDMEESDNDEDDNDEETKVADEKDNQTHNGTHSEVLDDVNEGRTIFVRDLPYDATPADLKRAFGRYGLVELALIVKDKVTGLARGSGFVKFSTREGALLAVESAEIGSRAEMATIRVPPTVNGRPCRVNLAVDRQEAKKLKDSENSGGKDKRNLYLATEGLLVDTAVSLKRHGDLQKSNEDMSEGDREKRRRAHTEKKKKLANPLYFVSPTRICIRNLKKSLNNSDVYNLCIKAAAEGIKNGLVSESDNEAYLAAQCVPIRERTPDKLAVPPALEGKDATGKRVVLSAKIMLDDAKRRGPGATPQSRGYGFVEFSHHCYALSCVRELNNNTLYAGKYAQNGNAGPGKASTLIVEFSLENVQKIQVLNERKERRMARKDPSPTTTPTSPSPADQKRGEEEEQEEEAPSEKGSEGKRKRSSSLEKGGQGQGEGEGEEQQIKKKQKRNEIKQKRKLKEQRRNEKKKERGG